MNLNNIWTLTYLWPLPWSFISSKSQNFTVLSALPVTSPRYKNSTTKDVMRVTVTDCDSCGYRSRTWSGARHSDHKAPLWASTVSRRLPDANSKICSFPLWQEKTNPEQEVEKKVSVCFVQFHVSCKMSLNWSVSQLSSLFWLYLCVKAERIAVLSTVYVLDHRIRVYHFITHLN